MPNTSTVRSRAGLSLFVVASLLAILAVVMIAARVPHTVAEFRANPPDAFSDFNYYLYAFSTILHQPSNASLIYDHDGLVAFLRGMGARDTGDDVFYTYPPQFALMFSRLAAFTPLTAKAIWALASIALWVTGVTLMTRMAYRGRDRAVVLLLVAIALLSRPMFEDVYWGQSNALSFFLLAATFFLVDRGNRYLAGVFLALAIALKITPLAVAGLLLLRREWRTAISTFVFSFLITAFTVSRLGARVVWHYFTSDLARLSDRMLLVGGGGAPANNSVRGALQTVSGSIGMPLSQSSLGTLSTLFSAFVCLLAAYLIFRRNHDRRIDYALAAATLLAATPVLEPIHFVVSLIPLLILFGTAFEQQGAIGFSRRSRTEMMLGALAVLLMMFAARSVGYTLAMLIIYGLCVARYFPHEHHLWREFRFSRR